MENKPKRKVLKNILLVLLLIVIIFLILTTRKMIVISSLSNKANQYVGSTNYHRINYVYNQDSYSKTEIYRLNDRQAIIMTRLVGGEKVVVKIYANGNTRNQYTEAEGIKTALLNQKGEVFTDVQNPSNVGNLWNLFVYSITASISNESCNGKDCYLIKSSYIGFEGGIYINKETGLTVHQLSSDMINLEDGSVFTNPSVDYIYEFNTVTENDFIEPDINEYEVV